MPSKVDVSREGVGYNPDEDAMRSDAIVTLEDARRLGVTAREGRVRPFLVLAWLASALLCWSTAGTTSQAWGQTAPPGTVIQPAPGEGSPAPAPTEEQAPTATETPAPEAQAPPPPAASPGPTQYPPAFQLLQQPRSPLSTWPFSGAPQTPEQGSQIPPWTAPIEPLPSQRIAPLGLPLPVSLLTVGGGKLFELHPTLLLSESWTDNFNQTATNKLQDFRTVFGPGAALLINGPNTHGYLSGNAGLTYDTASSPAAGFNVFPNGVGVLQHTFNPRLSVTFTDTFTRNNSPNEADVFGLNTQRQTFVSNGFNTAVTYQLDLVTIQGYYVNSLFLEGGTNGVNTVSNIFGVTASSPLGPSNTVSLGYQYSLTDTSGTSASTNSGLTTGNLFTASVLHQLGLNASAGLQGSYQTLSVPQSSDQSGDEHIWNISLVGTYGLPSGLSVSASLGYGQLTESGRSPESLVTTNTTLSYTFAQAVASVGFFSDFRQTGLQGQNFGVVKTQGFAGSFAYAITPLITFSAQAGYSQNTFTGVGNSALSPNENNLLASARLIWQALPWLVVSGYYSYLLRSGPTGSITGPGSIPVNTLNLSLYGTF